MSTQEESSALPLALATLAGAAAIGIFFLWRRSSKEAKVEPQKSVNSGANAVKPGVPQEKKSEKKKADAPKGSAKAIAKKEKHPLEYAVLKGHTEAVKSIDFSLDGRFLASVSVDRTVRLWYTSSFAEANHRSVRINLDTDHASCVAFSPDSQYILVALAESGVVRVYKLGKKSEKNEYVDAATVKLAREFPRAHSAEMLSLHVARNGRFVLGAYADTTLVLWSVKGDVLEKLDSKQMTNNCATISPDGRFVACGGFTPDVKIWEVRFDKSGGYEKTARAMELSGHTSGIHSVAFSLDTTRAVTLSKDGTWRLWDINVNYELRQDPKLLLTSACASGVRRGCVALSPDASMVAAAVDKSLRLYSADGKLLEEISDAHDGAIEAVIFDVNADFLATSSSGERHVRVWQNNPILKIRLIDLKFKLNSATNDLYKQRLRQQVAETEGLIRTREAEAVGTSK